MRKQYDQGIYTLKITVDKKGNFNGNGILTYPSGKAATGNFKNNQLQIG